MKGREQSDLVQEDLNVIDIILLGSDVEGSLAVAVLLVHIELL